MRYIIASLLVLLLQACSSSGERIDHRAAAAGLSREVIDSSPYRHVIYTRTARPETQAGLTTGLTIFIEGDGRPWSPDGQQPSEDPTTRRPLALQLLEKTASPAMYVSRPCYQQLVDANCSSAVWTSERYSKTVVESIAEVIRRKAAAAGSPSLTLIGYSGGGVLATLVAEQLSGVDTVITIAANLDIDAWTKHHRYLPLTGSLNPASSAKAHPWREIHLQGARDEVVPPDTTTAYFQRYPQSRRLMLDRYDHVCCWVRDWSKLSAQVDAALREAVSQSD